MGPTAQDFHLERHGVPLRERLAGVLQGIHDVQFRPRRAPRKLVLVRHGSTATSRRQRAQVSQFHRRRMLRLPRRSGRTQPGDTTRIFRSRSTKTSRKRLPPSSDSLAVAAGCTYVQLDDTNLAYLCDDKMRESARGRGDDPDELPHLYARAFINRLAEQKPAGMTLAMHLCRGNFKSTWAAQGGYEPVAEALLAEMNLDAYFLEYDDERSGDFRPLRFLPRGKIVVLRLRSPPSTAGSRTKTTSSDASTKRRSMCRFSNSHSRLVRCFASTVHGNCVGSARRRSTTRSLVEAQAVVTIHAPGSRLEHEVGACAQPSRGTSTPAGSAGVLSSRG